MNENQKAIHAALKIGARGVAQVYEAVCRQPGLNVSQVSRIVGHKVESVSGQVVQLERAGLIRTEKTEMTSQRRLCWPVVAPDDH